MARTAKLIEWIGKSDDHRAPGTIRTRIFDRERGTCHLCSTEIQTGQKWDLDHIKALINGGENRESNLKPAHLKCHKDKTARDVAEKAKVAAMRGRHIGAKRAESKLARKSPKQPKQSRHSALPPRAIYTALECTGDAQ